MTIIVCGEQYTARFICLASSVKKKVIPPKKKVTGQWATDGAAVWCVCPATKQKRATSPSSARLTDRE